MLHPSQQTSRDIPVPPGHRQPPPQLTDTLSLQRPSAAPTTRITRRPAAPSTRSALATTSTSSSRSLSGSTSSPCPWSTTTNPRWGPVPGDACSAFLQGRCGDTGPPGCGRAPRWGPVLRGVAWISTGDPGSAALSEPCPGFPGYVEVWVTLLGPPAPKGPPHGLETLAGGTSVSPAA